MRHHAVQLPAGWQASTRLGELAARLSQAMERSTIQRLGEATNTIAVMNPASVGTRGIDNHAKDAIFLRGASRSACLRVGRQLVARPAARRSRG
jgi:hypothetical protein